MFFRAFARLRAPLAVGIVLLAFALGSSRAQDAPGSAGPAIELRIAVLDGGQPRWIVTLPDGSRLSLDPAAPRAADRELRPNRNLTLSAGTNGLILRAQGDIGVAFPELAGLRLLLSAGALVRATPMAAAGGLGIHCETSGTKLARAELPDGAVIELRSTAAMRFETFVDGTYYVTGQRGAVLITAEGQKVEGTAFEEPWTGGALRRRDTAAEVAARLERSSPVIPLSLDGVLGAEIRVEGAGTVGSKVLRPGVPERLAFDNGAVMVLEHDGTRRAVVWQVERGLFEVAIAGAGSARFLAMTGQRGEWVFDVVAQVFDVHNPMTQGDLLVRLPGAVTAHVGPHATFQFAPLDALSFAATRVGGTVRLTSAVPGVDQVLPGNRIWVRNGMLRGGAAVGVPATDTVGAETIVDGGALSVAWPSAQAVEVSGVGGGHRSPGGR